MILSATLSKPAGDVAAVLGNDFLRVKIKISASSADFKDGDAVYLAEFYTKTQVFHKKMSGAEVCSFIEENVPRRFKNCVERTDSEEITLLANKKGEVTRLVKKLQNKTTLNNRAANSSPLKNLLSGNDRRKNYILREGVPVPFLVRLGIMTAQGKVIAAKYDKFRQINRFLEILSDAIRELPQKNEPVSVVDFGSGKSYLTFAVQYYLTEILGIECQIFGLDLKKDVIEYCSKVAEELSLKNLEFAVGDIAQFGEDKKPDIIITLHACDTATDYALNYAVKKDAKVILSVPCCQHEINLQLKKSSVEKGSPFESLLKYGLIKERFAALVTDAVRGELLENAGYKVQMLEFIDDEGTPKNLMIRAVKKDDEKKKGAGKNALLETLKVNQTLEKLLKE